MLSIAHRMQRSCPFGLFRRVRAQEKGELDSLNCTSRTTNYTIFLFAGDKNFRRIIPACGASAQLSGLNAVVGALGWHLSANCAQNKAPAASIGTLRRR